MRRPFGVGLALCLTVISGCLGTTTSSRSIDYPSGPSLEQFGLRERCADGGDCSERAMEAIVAALGRLGPEIRNTPVTSPGGAPAADPVPPDRLVVGITVDPMLEWQATTGAGGSGSAFRVDLTDDNPYVVVAPRFSFRLSDEDATAIRDALFVER
jgi:hypothetical protein